jgi:hypothetical protein
MSILKLTRQSGHKSTRSLLGLAALALPVAAFALPQVTDEKGFSGYVAAGAAYADVKSNVIAGNKINNFGKQTISDVNQGNVSTDKMISAIAGEVRWNVGNRNEIFLGTSVEDKVTMDGGAQLGWRKGTDSAGTFQLGVISTALARKVWNDPYRSEENQPGDPRRGRTDRDGNGARFQWDRIFNTGFEVQLTARDIDVDQEQSGWAEFGEGSDEARDLRRDGDYTSLGVGYLFSFADGKHLLRPEIKAVDMDADGDAQDYDGATAKLTYSYLGDVFKFVTNVSAGEQDFDTNNPIYDDEQDSDIVAADASLFYTLPFDSKRWQLIGNVFYGEIDSDIDFHDTDVFSAAVLVQYQFGAQKDVRAGKAR